MSMEERTDSFLAQVGRAVRLTLRHDDRVRKNAARLLSLLVRGDGNGNPVTYYPLR